MEVTLLFTTVLSVFMIVLAVRVLDLRGSPVTKFFHKPNREIDPNDLERAIRGHGNLTEYAPLFLILMLTLELSDASVTLLYMSGIIFTLGRLMHGIAFSFMKKNVFLRIGGMALTFTGFFILIRTAIEQII
ncbi:MAPEG family protein [Gammaproteobacteria bacterium]|nr:MAPEG family protein [Gammaproteobacteria bacterium]|tara:strand:- start:191 stop:586 length:396 start_codon:yes stop_codon:yes gene_type:complete